MEDLSWPPNENDLRRLYSNQKLSAAKIARAYGLSYPNPKSGETLVLYYLRKFGIARRDRAEHIRKVTPEMVNEWRGRYQAGESLKQIAADKVDPVTVWNHLRNQGVSLRNKVEAQILAVTKHRRRPFDGNAADRAYLLGFARGDLYVARHGRLTRVKTASTHPALLALVMACFGDYGPCYVSPKKSSLTGFEWAITCDLDTSFSFLLHNPVTIPKFATGRLFLSYLAGFFDAEGSIFMNSNGWFEISITNSNTKLLSGIASGLRNLGIVSKIQYSGPTALSPSGGVWRLRIWRRPDVIRLLDVLPIRHPEKIAKRKLVSELYKSNYLKTHGEPVTAWVSLLNSIKRERDQYVKDAAVAYLSRQRRVNAGASTIGPLQPANNSRTSI